MALADKDVDETMAADWASIREKYTPEELDVPEADAPEVEAEPAESIPVSREADGKFKAQEKDKAPTDPKPKAVKDAKLKTTPAATKEASTPDAPKAGAAEVVPEPSLDATTRDINRAPSTWRPTARAEWEKLPPAIRTEIHRREADFLNGQAQLRPDAELGKSMRQVVEPYRGMIEAEGGTPERAFADLLRTAAVFRTGSVQAKYQAIAQIAQQFGIDLRPLGQAAQNQPVPPSVEQQQFRDPRVDQLLAHQQRQEREQAQRETQNVESAVTRWMNEVDAAGNPSRPYLSDVINEMSGMLPQIRATDPTLTHTQALEAAYDRAIWANPEIRTLLAQKQQTDLEAKRRAENQQAVRDAKRAGSVNVPRRASIPAPGKPGRIEDTIASTARELGLITS